MLSQRIQNIQNLLIDLEREPGLELGQEVVKAVVGLLIPESENLSFRQFTDQGGKLTANAGWFQNDSVITDRLATYILEVPRESNLDIKLYGVNAASMRTIAWAVGLTENFEDEPFNGKFNVGIDFIIPKTLDRVTVALSKNYIVRTIELKGHLTATFQQILNSWTQISDLSRKAEFHSILWNSFDLQPINKRFYEGISQRFIHLRQHLENSNIFDSHHAAQFANRLVGRLIFSWFLDKKRFLNEKSRYFESGDFSDDSEYYRERLEPLFFEVLNVPISDRKSEDLSTPYLNGGLFEAKLSDLYKSAALTFPKNYFDDFLGFLRGYNFTTDESTSDFQQVAIDPEMLGRIFENLLAEVNEETGEQARKAKGAFYTPRQVVDFMCKEALRSYLKTQIADDEHLDRRLYQLIDAPEREFLDQDHNWRRDLKPYKKQLVSILDELRVIDPACGSGAFPIGMLQLLVKVYSRLEARFDAYKTKLSIIEKNLFGIDIEPMAVEISRLRAWLALVVVEGADVSSVQPLPNLDFKFVCANSLNSLDNSGQFSLFEDHDLDLKLQEIRDAYFSTQNFAKKTKLKAKYQELVDEELTLFGESRRTTQLKTFRPFDSESTATFFDPFQMFGVVDFDIVIGNPPYVSNKGREAGAKKDLMREFGFADDLYTHFFFKGFRLLSKTGVIAYISSKTFWTIQSKANLRSLLLEHQINVLCDSSNPFASAMVDTCILVASNQTAESQSRFLLPNVDYSSFEEMKFNQNLYKSTLNSVFFAPSKANEAVHTALNFVTKELTEAWWPQISTSRSATMNEEELNDYAASLKPGDYALLGAIADGGVGLQTGNNGRYLGVIRGTKIGKQLELTRLPKIAETLFKVKDLRLGSSSGEILARLIHFSEDELSSLVESTKEAFGLDVFGKGFIYRLVGRAEIADPYNLSKEEKIIGLQNVPKFVPYDKGDKEGNSWHLATPFVIDWSQDAVKLLKQSVGLKVGGSRYQNSHLFFKDGICWILTLNENSEYLKARFRSAGVFDVNAMTIFLREGLVTDKYIVCLLNSYLIFHFKKHFLNGTSAFQINDARQIPVRIPTSDELIEFEDIFDRAVAQKLSRANRLEKDAEASLEMEDLQKELDGLVFKLYGVDPNLFDRL